MTVAPLYEIESEIRRRPADTLRRAGPWSLCRPAGGGVEAIAAGDHRGGADDCGYSQSSNLKANGRK